METRSCAGRTTSFAAVLSFELTSNVRQQRGALSVRIAVSGHVSHHAAVPSALHLQVRPRPLFKLLLKILKWSFRGAGWRPCRGPCGEVQAMPDSSPFSPALANARESRADRQQAAAGFTRPYA